MENQLIEDHATSGPKTEGNEVDASYQPDKNGSLGTFGGIYAIVSTIVGGGIVGLPYGF